MKILTLTLFACLAMAQAQNTEFVNSMLQLHHDSASSFNLISYMIENTRDSVLSYLTEFNAGAVKEISEGLRETVTLRDHTQQLIDTATGSENCIRVTVENWENAMNSTGPSLASCALRSNREVRRIMADINAEYVEQHKSTFSGQNLMLNAFSGINIITNQQQIPRSVNDEAARISQNFFVSGMFELYRLLDELADFVQPALEEMRECVQALTSRLNDEAIVVANTLEFC